MIQNSFIRRVISRSPLLVGTYAASTAIAGFGFRDPAIDILGLASTTTAYMATETAIERWRRRASDRELNS